MIRGSASAVGPRSGGWLWGALLAATSLAMGVAWKMSRGPVREGRAVGQLYDRLAPAYDLPARMFEVIGARGLRLRAVAMLELQPRDTVVDLGCGSGFNLSTLARAVGPAGRIVGVDLSAGMLSQARLRANRQGLTQVTLVESDMREYNIPAGTAAVLATFSLEMVPEHDAVLKAVAQVLKRGNGRVAVLGLRRPEGWPEWVITLGRLGTSVFGVTRAYEAIQPWRSVQHHFTEVSFETSAAGALYLSVGQADS